MINKIEKAIIDIRKSKPLILNITNYVTMDFMANSLLAIGAAPLMSICDDELEELTSISSCININIGTLDNNFIERCTKVVAIANKLNKPIVLDPVGSGASVIRTKTARCLMPHTNIIRGNASEIMSLCDDGIKTFGVESLNSTDCAKNISRIIAKNHNVTVAVSGETDLITDGKEWALIAFGSKLMPIVTGMGCVLNAVICAFRSVVDDSFLATQLATTYCGICGNLAEAKSSGSGTFKLMFIDELSKADFDNMKKFYYERSAA